MLAKHWELWAAGIDTPALAVMPFGGIDEWDAVKGLSPVLPSV